jgi:hypothetical protein
MTLSIKHNGGNKPSYKNIGLSSLMSLVTNSRSKMFALLFSFATFVLVSATQTIILPSGMDALVNSGLSGLPAPASTVTGESNPSLIVQLAQSAACDSSLTTWNVQYEDCVSSSWTLSRCGNSDFK